MYPDPIPSFNSPVEFPLSGLCGLEIENLETYAAVYSYKRGDQTVVAVQPLSYYGEPSTAEEMQQDANEQIARKWDSINDGPQYLWTVTSKSIVPLWKGRVVGGNPVDEEVVVGEEVAEHGPILLRN